MDRHYWSRRIAELDPELDFAEIYRITVAHEFPWDMNQALSFALFRTYAVPSVGALLARTDEFTTQTRKRYEDTALLLDAVLEHGGRSPTGREAVRRINRMHAAYDISNDDMRYVLSTFVVVPIRWMDDYGWRPLSEAERVASVHYYRDLGALMGIRDVPETWQEFVAHLDAYETEHFAYEEGARAVADATLDFMASLPPHSHLPASWVRTSSYALMDPALRQAFGYPTPPAPVVAAVRAGLRARGRLLRLARPRMTPMFARDLPTITGYPDGYDVAHLGTFPPGCPMPHQRHDAALGQGAPAGGPVA